MADTPTPKKPAAKRAPRKPAVKKTATPKPVATEPEITEAQREEVRREYIELLKEEQAQAANQKRYVRNMSGAPFRMKLTRHSGGQQGIALKPRGERGDISPLEANDLEDMILRDNLALGLIEIITEMEAHGAMGKQTTNQQAVHPALAALRNEKGQDGMVLNVDKSMEEQGIVVAQLEDGQIAFERGKGGPNIVRRQPGEAPGVPANIPGAEPGNAPANEAATFLSDLRSNAIVNPTQKS